MIIYNNILFYFIHIWKTLLLVGNIVDGMRATLRRSYKYKDGGKRRQKEICTYLPMYVCVYVCNSICTYIYICMDVVGSYLLVGAVAVTFVAARHFRLSVFVAGIWASERAAQKHSRTHARTPTQRESGIHMPQSICLRSTHSHTLKISVCCPLSCCLLSLSRSQLCTLTLSCCFEFAGIEHT